MWKYWHLGQPGLPQSVGTASFSVEVLADLGLVVRVQVRLASEFLHSMGVAAGLAEFADSLELKVSTKFCLVLHLVGVLVQVRNWRG